MKNIQSNPFSSIEFNLIRKQINEKLMNVKLPFFNFCKEIKSNPLRNIRIILSVKHFQSIFNNEEKRSKLITTAITIIGLSGSFFGFKSALIISSGFETIESLNCLVKQITAEELNMTKVGLTSLRLIKNAVNLASVISPSPQMIIICLTAQTISQLYQTVKTVSEKGICLESAAGITYTGLFAFNLISEVNAVAKVISSEVGKRIYVPIEEIFPGQVRYSSQNVEQKVNKILKTKAAIPDRVGGYIYNHHDGKSVYSLKESVPVIKASFGYVPIDGHHDVLASQAIGAKWIPVEVVKNWDYLPRWLFWQIAESKGFVYLTGLNGKKSKPLQNFNQLTEDPNRYFAAISARKLLPNGTTESSIGSDYPLWIKIGKDIPFIEFKISDVLLNSGLVYHSNMEKDPKAYENFIELARNALLKNPISGLRVVPKKTYFNLINLDHFGVK